MLRRKIAGKENADNTNSFSASGVFQAARLSAGNAMKKKQFLSVNQNGRKQRAAVHRHVFWKKGLYLFLICILCAAFLPVSISAGGIGETETGTKTEAEAVQVTSEGVSGTDTEAEPGMENETEPVTDLNTLEIPEIADQVYDGGSCEPAVNINGLEQGKDFTVQYYNNTAPGSAYAVITGIGLYEGTVRRDFTIGLKQVNVEKISNLSGGIQISWSKAAGASGYYIFRKEASGEYSRLAAVEGGSVQSYTDTKVTAGKDYTYKVQARCGEISGAESAEKGIRYLTSPSSVSAAYNSDGIKVSWSKTTGAGGYDIYRRASGETTDTRVKTITGGSELTWTDTDISDNVKYTYRAAAWYQDSASVLSESASVVPAEPVLVSASSVSYNSIRVKWKDVSGEDGYYIYRRTEQSSWSKVAQVGADTVSWDDKSLTCGKKYYYSVQAFVQNGTLLSTFDQTGRGTSPVPAAPALSGVTSKDSSVVLTWKKVSGATSYKVYRKTGTGSWKKLADVKSTVTTYEDKTAKYGVKYHYTVKSMRNSITGKYNKTGLEGAVKASAVTMKSVYVGSDGKAVIHWEKRSGVDGYFIYRKIAGGKWEKAGSVTAGKTSWSENNLESDKKYWYTVNGYITLNNKKVTGKTNKTGMAPELEYTGEYVRNVTKTCIGTTGAGRKMYSYTIGSGDNHIVLTMAIHAWEDNWKKDGAVLVKTGNKLIQEAAKKTSTLAKYNYSIIVVPMANPDGLYSGTTCNGPGRCTVYRYNSKGRLVKGGVDLNRSFPSGFKARYTARNYTGNRPLMAKEAVVLKKFVDSSKGKGKNIFIDAHGWYNQTITYKNAKGSVYSAFKKYFPGTRGASLGGGYISTYAQKTGYEAALFEFPYVSSEANFNSRKYASKFISTVFYMVKKIK